MPFIRELYQKFHGQSREVTEASFPHNFLPSPETIEAALVKGFTNVLNPEEFQKFINHNLTHLIKHS